MTLIRGILHFKTFKSFLCITGVCTLNVSTNTGHLQVSLKLLMKLLCLRPYVQLFVYAPVYAPICPVS
jgi:hypothetical protein